MASRILCRLSAFGVKTFSSTSNKISDVNDVLLTLRSSTSGDPTLSLRLLLNPAVLTAAGKLAAPDFPPEIPDRKLPDPTELLSL